MSLTLPVEFQVSDTSLQKGMDKAAKAAAKEAERANKAAVAALKRAQAQVESEQQRHQRYLLSLQQRYYAEQQRMAERAAKEAERIAKAAAEDRAAGAFGIKASSIEAGTAALRGMATGVAVVAGAALGGGAALSTMAAQIDEISDASVRTTLSASTIEAIGQAATISGSSLQAVLPSLEAFQRRLVDGADGSGGMAEGLAKLGISATDAAGQLRPTDAVLKEVFARIAGLSSETDRAAAATLIFGRAAGPILETGLLSSEGALAALIAQVEGFGISGAKAAEAANRWQASTAGLTLALKGAGAELFGTFGPTAAAALNQFTLGLVAIRELGWIPFQAAANGAQYAWETFKAAFTDDTVEAATKRFLERQEALKADATASWEATRAFWAAQQATAELSVGTAKLTFAKEQSAEATTAMTATEKALIAAEKEAISAEKARVSALAQAKEALAAVAAAANLALATDEERIQIAAQQAREAAATAAAEAQYASTSAAERKRIAQDLRDTLDAINQGELRDRQALEADKVDAAQQAAADIASAYRENVLNVISSAQGGLEGIATLIGGPVAGAITGLILNLEDTVGQLKETLLALPKTLEALPGLVTDLVVTIIEKVVPALIEAAPAIAEAFALAVSSAEFLTALAKAAIYLANPLTQAALWAKVGINILAGFWDAFVAGWESFVSGEMVAGFTRAFAEGVTGAIEAIGAFFERLIAEIKDFFSVSKDESKRFGDALKEVFTLGQAKTSYGDTPGPIRIPDIRQVTFERGDFVAAARTREQLARQVGTQSPGPVSLSLSDGHLAFDRELRRATRQPRTRTELRGMTVARRLA